MSSILLRLKKITLDKKIQPRVALSQDIINEYCEAHINGDEFPAPVVFEEKNKYYLADGWHRIEAAIKAKITDIECEVIRRSCRDAIKYSLSANSIHGLNRTHSDKRKAVETCIDDPEWSQRSVREIAKLCGLSHTFVNNVYKERADAKALKEGSSHDTNGGNVSTPAKKGKGKQSSKKSDSSKTDEKKNGKKSGFDTSEKKDKGNTEGLVSLNGVFVIPVGMKLVEQYSYEETMNNYKETLDENAALHKMIDSDEPMKVAAAELKKVTHKFRIVESRVAGLMSEKNEALKLVRSHKSIIDKLNKQVKGFGATEEF